MHLGQHKAAAVLTLTLGVSVLAVAAPAQAVTDTIDYACTLGTTSFTMPTKWDSNAPVQAFYGDAASTVFSAEGTLPGEVAKALYDDGGRSFAGSLDRGVTVHDAADQAGPTLPVAYTVPATNLGDQTAATAVPVKVTSAAFTGKRSNPGKLTYKASGFTAALKVTQADSTVKDVAITCALPGAAPTISATDWIARTTTAITLSKATAEYGQPVAVHSTVTPAAGTAVGDLTVSAGGLDSKVAVNGNSPTVYLRDLPIGSYEVAAKFDPTDVTFFRGSSTAGSSALKVVKTRSRLAIVVRGKTRRVTTRVSLGASGVHGTAPSGKATFVLRSLRAPYPKKFRAKILSGGGEATAYFGKLRAGRYRLTTTYKGDNEHLRKVSVRTFNVTR